jgi:hypothetical protein
MLAGGYAGCNGVAAGNQIACAGCWAHLKRKFIGAGKTAPQIAREAIASVRALYTIERQAKDAKAEDRLAMRREQSMPLAVAFRQQLLAWKAYVRSSEGFDHSICRDHSLLRCAAMIDTERRHRDKEYGGDSFVADASPTPAASGDGALGCPKAGSYPICR